MQQRMAAQAGEVHFEVAHSACMAPHQPVPIRVQLTVNRGSGSPLAVVQGNCQAASSQSTRPNA